MKTYKKVCLLVLAGLLIATPLILLVGTGVVLGGSAVSERTFMHVLSPSMEPALHKGDLIIVRPCAPEDVQIGDIISYRIDPPDVIITHRVRNILTELDGKQGLWFIAQGDANNVPDFEPVEASRLAGKYIMRLPGVGAAINWLHGHPAIAILAAVLLCLLCLPAAALLVWLALRRRVK